MGSVVQYGIQTPHSKTILMVTEDPAEARHMLEMIGEGRLISRTIRYGPWHIVDEEDVHGLPGPAADTTWLAVEDDADAGLR